MHATYFSQTLKRRLLAPLRQAAILAMFIAAVFAAACAGEPTPTPTPEPAPTSTPTATPTPTAFPSPTAAHTPRPISLPADEAPHTDPVEWWYYSGSMQDENGAEYGFHFVIFQVTNPESGEAGYMSHASVLDVGEGLREQSVRFGVSVQAQPATGFNFSVGGWTLNGDDGTHSFAATTDTFAFDLTVETTKPAVLHNRTGYLEALNGWTYYYSWTDMDLRGTLTVNGQDLPVTGEAWMDHQWGDFVVSGYPSGWQWFAVSMDNDYELMVAEARESDGQVITYSTLVDPSGATTHIDDEDITVEVLGAWTSPHTGGKYPAGWRITIPPHDISMTLTPLLDDQEFTLAFPPNTIYWEGLTETDITFRGELVGGSAYVELVGYAPPPTPTP